MRLEVGKEGTSSGRAVDWDGRSPLVIGRSRRTDLVVSDPLLSRRHCRLEMEGEGVFLVDLDSANGTFLNGTRCQRAQVQAGDAITFGGSWLRLSLDEEESRRVARMETDPHMPSAAASDPYPNDAETLFAPEIDGYEIFGVIGRGSFGTVFRGRQLASGREVAIKVLPTGRGASRDAIKRFLREISALGQLDHPNLVAVLGAGEGPDYLFLIMELAGGGSVKQQLAEGEGLPLAEALDLALQLTDGLAHAHARGFAHRDVKPENVLLDEGGRVKLCDFGLVKAVGTRAGDGMTRPGEGFGSVAYMAPEQVRSAHKADERADVYAIGSTLYHMLTGHKPFSGKVTRGLLRRLLHEMPRPIGELAPGVPADVVDIVERCMQKEPAARYPDMRELREALEQVRAACATPDGVAAEAVGGDGAEVCMMVGDPGAAAERGAGTGTFGGAGVVAGGGDAGDGGGRHGATVAGMPAFEDDEEMMPDTQHAPGRTVAGMPAFDPEEDEAEERAAAQARATRGRTVVGLPAFDAKIEAPAARPAYGPSGTLVELPAFEDDEEEVAAPGRETSGRGRTVVAMPAFDDDDEATDASAGGAGRGRTVVAMPAFDDEEDEVAPPAAAPPGRGRTVVAMPAFDDEEGDDEAGAAAAAAPGRGRTVVALPAFDDEDDEAVPPAAAPPGRGRTVVALPAFDDEDEGDPAAAAAPGRGRTVVALPAFADDDETGVPGPAHAPSGAAAPRAYGTGGTGDPLHDFASGLEVASATPPAGDAGGQRFRVAATEVISAYAPEGDDGVGAGEFPHAGMPPGGGMRGAATEVIQVPEELETTDAPVYGAPGLPDDLPDVDRERADEALRVARTELFEAPDLEALGVGQTPGAAPRRRLPRRLPPRRSRPRPGRRRPDRPRGRARSASGCGRRSTRGGALCGLGFGEPSVASSGGRAARADGAGGCPEGGIVLRWGSAGVPANGVGGVAGMCRRAA
jgi:serine/threonine-protein kinase